MADLVIDTDVASVLIKRRAEPWITSHLTGNQAWLTFVTVAELAKWAQVRSWGVKSRQTLDAWLDAQPTVPFVTEIAKLWGQLAGNAQARGRPRPQNDMWIAACSIHHDVPLLTINQRDFEDFAEHEGLRLLR